MDTQETFRIMSATIPSSVYLVSICAGLNKQEGAKDILLLHSDFYEGNNLKQYELVMHALSKGHSWSDVRFCNGISHWLEHSGRMPLARSRLERVWRDHYDGKRIYRTVNEAFAALGVDETQSSFTGSEVSELWVDGPTSIAQFLFPKYKSAKKVLYPHGEGSYQGNWNFKWPDAEHRRRIERSWKRRLRDTVTSIAPAVLPVPKVSLFDEAYTTRGEHYLAEKVFDVGDALTVDTLKEYFSFLPADAQSYLNQIGAPVNNCRPSVLFFTTTRGPQDFDKELEALIHLLNVTVETRGSGPVVIKPHPRGSERHMMTMIQQLRDHFPQTTFKVISEWSAVPVEVAISNWKISCCLGLFTTSLGTVSRLFGVPAYIPIKRLKAIYRGDRAFEGGLNNWLQIESDKLVHV